MYVHWVFIYFLNKMPFVNEHMHSIWLHLYLFVSWEKKKWQSETLCSFITQCIYYFLVLFCNLSSSMLLKHRYIYICNNQDLFQRLPHCFQRTIHSASSHWIVWQDLGSEPSSKPSSPYRDFQCSVSASVRAIQIQWSISINIHFHCS